MARRCPNCKVPLDWGVLCADCVRVSAIAFVTGVGAGIGGVVAAILWRASKASLLSE